MTDNQILSYALAALPTMLTVLVGILINDARLSDLRAHMDARFSDVDKRFNDVDKRFNEIDRRFNTVDRRFDDITASKRFSTPG